MIAETPPGWFVCAQGPAMDLAMRVPIKVSTAIRALSMTRRRPSVYVENGHVTAVTLAAIDVEKNLEKPNDNHGSKVLVIPFDGAALDRDLQSASGTTKH